MNKMVLVALCVAAVGCGGAVDATSTEQVSVLPFRDAHTATSSSGGNLIDHGGKVLPKTNIYTIWWGNQTAFPSDAMQGISLLFDGLTGTSFLGITTQYMRQGTTPPTVSLMNSWVDSSSPPTHAPSVSTIVNEACRVLTRNGATPDTNGIYFVFSSNFPHANYCGYHSWGICNGTEIQVAYIPNTSNIAGCDPGNIYYCNSYSEGTRATANIVSHELSETITDSTLGAWYDSGGAEIGDKCNFNFAGCVSLTTDSWQLQQEWSNQASSCVQQ